MKNIYCIGGACVDYKLKSISTIVNASSNPVISYTSFGGVARNVAENLSNFTDRIYFQSVIGSDQDGQILLTNLKNKNINIKDVIIDSSLRTARYYAVLNPNGELHSAYADMEIYDQIPFQKFISSWQNWADNSLIFIDTNLSNELIQYAIYQAKYKKNLLCIDAVSAAKSKKIPLDLEGVFLLKVDQHEAYALTGTKIKNSSDVKAASKILLKRGMENLVISLGKNGYCIINKSGENFYPAIAIDKLIDVSGAGDAFFAGILSGLQKNLPLHDAARLGAAAAALTIQTSDTVLKNLTIEKIKELIRENKYETIF